MRGARVEEFFQPARERNDDRIFQHAHAHTELRPQVTHFEQERLAPNERHEPGRDRLKDRRRGAHDQVGVFDLQSCPHRAEHETEKGNDAPEITAMQGGINVRTQHAHAVKILLGVDAAVFNGAFARLVIQVTGYDDQFMSASLQKFRHLKMACVAWFIRGNEGLVE